LDILASYRDENLKSKFRETKLLHFYRLSLPRDVSSAWWPSSTNVNFLKVLH